MSYRILIADDHPLMRAALCQAVADSLPGAETIQASEFSGVETVLARDDGIDCVLLDLHMPGMNGLIGLVLLRNEHPAIPVIVVSAMEDAATIRRAMQYGASGFVPKSAPVDRLGAAIRAVIEGQIWQPDTDEAETAEDIDVADRIAGLTPQQLRVLAGIAEGKLNKQIAYEMGVVETTVKAHVTVILRRLGVVSRTQAAILAGRLALHAAAEAETAGS
ncbi:response regulator transcription factor [Tistrella mobilis]|jgi:DNA-binding NarL/FixJ family response regulator|uniref:response regulator transcription factor n=1 Tax=Tistrella mobilis TaxID=171437 RepID=UPI003558306F